ncbi:hypothetical protein [Georgenia muralis]|uniref:Uncharacterized protein n=1 Tax=Georgenia muralis TaxID=154117 RepID=A0A3N4Z9B9_9MICO|nr:hypothetical protein [Georgenia muralis]RPF28857.1 hypothetical protein EDD32_3403 [Georgenia muralis]
MLTARPARPRSSNDDLALVMGMNRLRRGHVDLDAGVEPDLITGTTEDPAGVGRTCRTYTMVGRRSASQLSGSTALLLLVVDVLVAGVFAALVAGSWDLERPVGLLGLLGGAAYVLVVAALNASHLRPRPPGLHRRADLRAVTVSRRGEPACGPGPRSTPLRGREPGPRPPPRTFRSGAPAPTVDMSGSSVPAGDPAPQGGSSR